jgi:hypothetical protein
MRDYRDLFFWDLFVHRNYLFVEDLLIVSRFLRTLCLTFAFTPTLKIVSDQLEISVTCIHPEFSLHYLPHDHHLLHHQYAQ